MKREIDFLGAYDAESVAAELRRIAEITGRRRVMFTDIEKLGRVSFPTVLRKFGTLRQANEAAGLTPSPVRRYSDEELLRMVLDVWDRSLKNSGRRPIRSDVTKYNCPVNPCTITARFGTWNKALLAANELSERNEAETEGEEPRKDGRVTIAVRKRFLVFKRDLYRCRICGKAGVELEVDHVIPLAQGGSSELENLQTLCVPCNRGKGDSLQ